MTALLGGSVGLVLAGPLGALLVSAAVVLWGRLRRRRQPDPPLRLVLLLLLVALRSGQSALAALLAASDSLPTYRSLSRVARVARGSGLSAALTHADTALRPVIAQLARAQRTGASLSGAVRRMLDQQLAADKTRRIARARSLPVRLMLPVTLLMLPGLVLLLYAPALMEMFAELTGELG